MPADTLDREQIKGARQRLDHLLAENDRIVDNAKIEDGKGVVVDPQAAKDFRSNLAEADNIKELLQNAEKQQQLREWADQPAQVQHLGMAPNAFGKAPNVKSLGEAFVTSPEFKSFLESKRDVMDQAFKVQGDLVRLLQQDPEKKDLYTNYPGLVGGPAQSIQRFGTTGRLPTVPLLFQQLHVRDLFPVQGTVNNMLEFIRVTGFVNNASVVPERAAGTWAVKPQSTLSFSTDQAPIRTIAHWEAAHRNTLADEPALRGLIDTQLLYGLLMAEDNQILNGTGTGEDIRGLLHTPGIQQQAAAGGDNPADTIRRAITKVYLSLLEPTGIVLHPLQWEDIELLKATGTGTYLLATAVAVGAETRLWRLPVVQTPMIADTQALVGAFGVGAQIYLREDGNVRVAEQHSDWFVRNAVAILAEERVGLAVPRPEAFVQVTGLA